MAELFFLGENWPSVFPGVPFARTVDGLARSVRVRFNINAVEGLVSCHPIRHAVLAKRVDSPACVETS